MSKLRQVHLLTLPRAAGGAHRGRTANGESESPPTATLMRRGSGRRIASLLLAVVAGVLLGTAAMTPAVASTGPSIAETATGANIAVQGPNHSLMFYWAANAGPTVWHKETVAGAGTTYSAPSIAETSTGVNITAAGPNHSLQFYWAANAGPTVWTAETVAGKGTTYSAPSIAETSTGVNITAVGSSNSLQFYWAANAGPTVWTAEQVAPPGSVS